MAFLLHKVGSRMFVRAVYHQFPQEVYIGSSNSLRVSEDLCNMDRNCYLNEEGEKEEWGRGGDDKEEEGERE